MIRKKNYIYAFLLSLTLGIIILLPQILDGKGILTIYGDFNNQQIPFGIHMNNMLKNGFIHWNWNNHLGNSFLVSYSFYNISSPFYLITLLFSGNIYPYLIGPMLILKYGVAGLTSYAYMQQFVKNKKIAILGSLLYSFSGFQITNMIFNHFHDIVALFPLLLLSLDNLVLKNKKGLFSIMITVLALTNYYFFVGQCVFLIIYFFANVISKRYNINKECMKSIVIEGIIGILISSIIIFPSILNILDNPRANIAWDIKSLFIYDLSEYLQIIKSFIISPDTMFSYSFIYARCFTSFEQYIPIFGIVFTFSYILKNKKSVFSIIILITTIFMFVPILNNSFSGFTSTLNYHRWFYMPILIYCVCIIKGIEDNIDVKYGFVLSAILYFIFLSLLFIGDYGINYNLFMFHVIISVIALITLFIIVKFAKNKLPYIYISVICMVIIISDFEFNLNKSLYTYNDKYYSNYSEYYKDQYLNIKNNIKLDNDFSYRIETIDTDRNLSILLNKPSLDSFISTYNSSMTNFFKSTLKYININMSQVSYYFYEQFPLSTFFSTKYIIHNNINKDNLKFIDLANELNYKYNNKNKFNYKELKMTDDVNLENLGFELISSDYYDVYENKNFIPFGLIYDEYITYKQFEQLDENERYYSYLKSVILTDEQIKKYSDIVVNTSNEYLKEIDYDDYVRDTNKHRTQNSNFKITKDGFNMDIDVSKDRLLLFTVPYDKGWSATVNGKNVDIEKVSNSFMAIRINKGENKVVFKYRTPGVKLGAVLSIIGIISFIIYIIINKRRRKVVKV